MEQSCLLCKLCNQTFNLTTRLPMTLSCCWFTVCSTCSSNLFQKEDDVCPFCMHRKERMGINKALKEVIQNTLSRGTITCDKHPDEQVSQWCKQDSLLFCDQCSPLHQEHQVENVELTDIEHFINSKIEQLQAMQDKVKMRTEMFKELKFKAKSMSSSKFIALANEDHSQLKQFSIKLGTLIQQKSEQIQYPKMFAFGSMIPEVNQAWGTVLSWFEEKGMKIARMEAQYRGTEHSFTAQQFHCKCDDSLPTTTLTFIKTEFGKVFGGFTSVPWSCSHYRDYPDESAFLISNSHFTLLNV